MLNYEEYRKIIDFIDHNELDRLVKYVTDEYKLKCLEDARNTLNNYLSNSHDVCYGYVDRGNLLVSDSKSIYMFKNDDLLNPYRRKKLNNFMFVEKNQPLLDKAYSLYSNAEGEKHIRVDGIYETRGSIMITSIGENLSYCFDKNSFYTSKSLLGLGSEYENYKLCKCGEIPMCVVKSDIGKGLILGIKK